MPAWPWRGARWPRPDARVQASAPVVLTAALAILALAKLGLLAGDLFGFAPAGPVPLAETLPAPRASPSVMVANPDDPGPMPAAGPDPPASAPAPAGAAVPEDPVPPLVPADPPPPLPDLEPSRLTASEIVVLQQLAERRTALDQRARELDQRQALLETAAAALDDQIAELSELRARIATAVEQHDAAEEARIKSLVKIYETMKAKAAAEIFNRLEMPVLIRVVERMREPKSADVLARMDPVKAKQVTTELARRSRLLETAGSAPASAAVPLANGG